MHMNVFALDTLEVNKVTKPGRAIPDIFMIIMSKFASKAGEVKSFFRTKAAFTRSFFSFKTALAHT